MNISFEKIFKSKKKNTISTQPNLEKGKTK